SSATGRLFTPAIATTTLTNFRSAVTPPSRSSSLVLVILIMNRLAITYDYSKGQRIFRGLETSKTRRSTMSHSTAEAMAPAGTTSQSAAEAIASAGGIVAALRNAQTAPTVFPVQPEFTNWRSEQLAWRESVALLDQSHHMTDLFIKGPDALKLLSDLGINNFSKFKPNMAKQFVAVNHEGYLIGDAILVYLEDGLFDLIGWHMVIDWVQYHGETGNYDVTFERDASSAVRDGDPLQYRFEVQGPNAELLMEKVSSIPIAKTKFFGMLEFEIEGRRIRAI